MTTPKNSDKIRKDIKFLVQTNLKYYRLKAKLTQEELAEKADVTNKYISDLERAKWYGGLRKLDAIAQALDIETYLLLKDNHLETKIPADRLDFVTKKRKSRRY